LAPGWRLVVC
jgi:hypothetical protein